MRNATSPSAAPQFQLLCLLLRAGVPWARPSARNPSPEGSGDGTC